MIAGRPDRRRRRPARQGEKRRRSTPVRSSRRSVSPRRAACCRRAKPAACRWCRSTCPRSTSSSCACRDKECRSFFAGFQRGGRRGGWELERDYPGTSGNEHAAVEAGRVGLREPLRARRQEERARADLPAGAGHRRAAGARAVFRGDEARRHVQGRVRHRVLHRQRHRPARARLQGQAVRACRVAEKRRARSAASS